MVNRRNVVYVVIATFVVALGWASLIGVEFSLISDQLSFTNSQRAAATSATVVGGTVSGDKVAGPDDSKPAANEGKEAAHKKLREVNDSDQAKEPQASGLVGGDDTTSAIAQGEQKSAVSGGDDQGQTPNTDDLTGEGETSAPEEAADPADLDESKAVVEEEPTEPNQDPENPATELVQEQQDANQYDLDELMTPELIEKIESQESDCLSPMHVHLLWIGDVEKAPRDHVKYAQMGYKLTVHTSADEILEGFHPYVEKAFRLAIPTVVGYDFLKFLMLYKHGGLSVDADTTPAIRASDLYFPSDCDVVFGKEARLSHWEKPIYRKEGTNTYGLNRPFQILNWAMAANKPRNPHIKRLIVIAMMHFFGLRDMEQDLIQDISGSGLMSDYVALLHEKEGRSYPEVYRDESKYVPVQGLCLTDGFLYGKWIRHSFLNSWRQPGAH